MVGIIKKKCNAFFQRIKRLTVTFVPEVSWTYLLLSEQIPSASLFEMDQSVFIFPSCCQPARLVWHPITELFWR